MKQSPCCARKAGAVLRTKGEVGRLARRLASQPHRHDYWMPQIERAKAEVKAAEAAKVDHEAEHAAEVATATTYSDYLGATA